jgi:hypothetical protein
VRGQGGGSDKNIYNDMGECVMTVGTGRDLSLQRIDISHLPKGVYFVKIGDYIGKFVKE